MLEGLVSEAFGGAYESNGDLRQVCRNNLADGRTSNGNKLAVIAFHQPADHLQALLGPELGEILRPHDYLKWSYQQLDTAANTVLSMLVDRGVTPGSKIVLYVYSCVELSIMLWASFKLGAVFVPLDPGILSREEELRYLQEILHPAVVVVKDELACRQFDSAIRTQSPDGPQVKLIIPPDSAEILPGWTKMTEALPYASRATPALKGLPQAGDEDVAAILFTSGTTGKPKGCLHTYRGLSAFSVMNTCFKIDVDSRVITNSMPFRAIYFSFSIDTFIAGGTVVLPAPTFSASSTLHALQVEKCTHLVAVPSQIYAYAATDYKPPDTPSVRVHVGGDFFPAGLVSLAQATLNPLEIKNIHGMTEGAGFITGRTVSSPDTTIDVSTPPSSIFPIGTPTPGHYAQICAPGTSEPLPRGQAGELRLAGPSLISSYYPVSVSSSSFHIDPSGRQWFLTGDQAVMAADGTITIHGRYKDVISRSGVKLSPSVIEVCLAADPVVKAVVVVACPSPTWGNVPVAVVELSLTDQARLEGKERVELEMSLKERARTQLGEESVPERVFTLQELGFGGWPLNGTGKIVRSDVVECVKARVESGENSLYEVPY